MTIELSMFSGGLIDGPTLIFLLILLWIIVDKKRGEPAAARSLTLGHRPRMKSRTSRLSPTRSSSRTYIMCPDP